jgi:NAD+ diphosphatase
MNTFSFPSQIDNTGYWIVVRGASLLVKTLNNTTDLPTYTDIQQLSVKPLRTLYVGDFQAKQCYAIEVAGDASAPEGCMFIGLRTLLSMLPEQMFTLAGRAYQLIDWDRTWHFCVRCASPLAGKHDECAKICHTCGYTSYPPVSPAIIVAVVRERQILLAHSLRFKPGMFSVLAGFVEAGESLEECVRREIREEVSIEVADIQYFGSMSWPFPHSLMAGFTCRYASGEIAADQVEIEEAGWYYADALPAFIPEKGTLSRRLIDWFIVSAAAQQKT